MPRQEVFMSEDAGNTTIEVIKTYDTSYAQEAFRAMGDEARRTLAATLEIDANYDENDVPSSNEADYEDLLWEELQSAAREDVRQSPILSSYFVVTERREGVTEDVYVGPDWPSAEGFAKRRLASL